MLSRLVAAFVVLVTFGNIAVAGIDDWDERQQTLSGGQARGRAFNFFGCTGSDISRTRVSFSGNYQPGTIVINTGERRLYLVQEGGTALRYGIGVGRVGFTWTGVRKVSEKKEWPGWTPPPQMLRRRPACRVTWRAASKIRSARARSISAPRSIAFTARTSRKRSARRCRRAASA